MIYPDFSYMKWNTSVTKTWLRKTRYQLKKQYSNPTSPPLVISDIIYVFEACVLPSYEADISIAISNTDKK